PAMSSGRQPRTRRAPESRARGRVLPNAWLGLLHLYSSLTGSFGEPMLAISSEIKLSIMTGAARIQRMGMETAIGEPVFSQDGGHLGHGPLPGIARGRGIGPRRRRDGGARPARGLGRAARLIGAHSQARAFRAARNTRRGAARRRADGDARKHTLGRRQADRQ